MNRLLLAAALALVLPASASASPLLPPRNKVYLYNQGNRSDGPFRLTRYPQGRKAIRKALKRKRFLGRP
jgi:hypothetical protein